MPDDIGNNNRKTKNQTTTSKDESFSSLNESSFNIRQCQQANRLVVNNKNTEVCHILEWLEIPILLPIRTIHSYYS